MKTIEEKLTAVLAARGEAYRQNLARAKEFAIEMKGRGVNLEQVIAPLNKVEA